MRVIMADDQPEVCSAMRLLLEEKQGITITGEVSNASDLLEKLRAVKADLVLLDWELPGSNPQELITLMREICPQLSIIALSSRPQVRQEALQAGSQEFVGKSDPPETLLEALDRCQDRLKG